MPVRTSNATEEGTGRIAALMGIASGNEVFDAVVEGTFHIDEGKQERFRNRLNIKDRGITRRFHQSDVATEENEELFVTKELPKWLSDRIGPFYTNEYITIRRKEHILHLLECVQNMELDCENKTSLLMYSKLFFNEISIIYKSFLETRQDEHFLSIVNLLEETLMHNELSKKILKETAGVLKAIKDSDHIEYSNYEQAVSRFFNIGADIISIEETPDDE